MSHDFCQKVVIITNAADDLGRAYSEYFLARGARLVLHDSCEADLSAVLKDLGAHDNIMLYSALDMTAPDAAQKFADEVIDYCGQIDILVNNRSAYAVGAFGELSAAQIRCSVNNHLLTTILMSQAVVTHMRTRGAGRIISTASAAGAFGAAGQAAFSAACAGVAGFMRSLGLELADTDIKVNTIAPMTESDHENYLAAPDPLVDRGLYRADTVAPIVAYLASEACQLNGRFLSITGGRVAHVFTSTVSGYFNYGEDYTQIGANLEAILDTNYPLVPESAADELLMIDV